MSPTTYEAVKQLTDQLARLQAELDVIRELVLANRCTCGGRCQARRETSCSEPQNPINSQA